MNAINTKSSKTNLEIDVPLTNVEMVLEAASLLCIIVSLAIASIGQASITIWTAMFPAIAIVMYLTMGYASRLPQYFRYLDGIAIEGSGGHQNMRETLALLRAEVVWTILCIQGIVVMITSIGNPTSRIMILVAFGVAWLLINSALWILMGRISRTTV